MTILLYDYCELEERTSKHFKTWKALHISIYALVALFGIVNYSFLEGTLELYNGNCILYLRQLEFHDVEIPCLNETDSSRNDNAMYMSGTAQNIGEEDQERNGTAQNIGEIGHERNETAQNIGEVGHERNETAQNIGERARGKNGTAQDTEEVDQERNVTTPSSQPTGINESNADIEKSLGNNASERHKQQKQQAVLEKCDGNETSWRRPALDVGRTLFGEVNDCEWALYTPLASTIFAAVWVTMFTMCPGGGRVRAGLQQPWRILAPALVFAVLLAIVTGHSFSRTSGGLHAFCASFVNVTNTTACSPVTLYTERAWNVSLGVGSRVAATRAASAGVWAGWACAAALLLARCVAAPDFVVRRTGVLLKDPQQRITSRLKKSPKKQHVQFAVRPGDLRDDTSVRSEPTLTSELVTASVEHHEDSTPSSIFNTPVRKTHEQESMLEMRSLPHIDDKTTPDQYQ